MILVHYRDGTTKKLDPRTEVTHLDSPDIQKMIRRVAIIDGNGGRIDLPSLKSNQSRIWVELVKNGQEIRGERVCMIRDKNLFKVTMYYSDGRFVVDF